MKKKEKILKILNKYGKDNFGINSYYIDNIEFSELAEELVKLFAIPDVSGLLPSEHEINLEANQLNGRATEQNWQWEKQGFLKGVKYVKNYIIKNNH